MIRIKIIYIYFETKILKVEKYDWDEFMAIKPCLKGKHEPKMV